MKQNMLQNPLLAWQDFDTQIHHKISVNLWVETQTKTKTTTTNISLK